MKPWQADLFAVVITAITFGVRVVLSDRLDGQPTLVIFTVPIMASAYLGGLRAGLVATVLSYLGASYFLLPPLHSFAIASGPERWQQFFVVLAGIVISGLNEALHRSRRRIEAQEVEINRMSRLYAALSHVNQAIVWSTERDQLFRKVCQVFVEHGGFQMAWIGWHDPTTHMVRPVASWGESGDLLHDVEIFTDGRAGSVGLVAPSVREGRPCISNDVLNDPAGIARREQFDRLGIRAVAVLPIRHNEEVVGAIVVHADTPGFFQDKEIALLSEAAVDVSFALDNFARRQAADQAAEHVARLAAIVEASDDAILSKDRNGIVKSWNPGAEKLLGYTAEEMIGQSVLRLFPPELHAQEEKMLARVLDGETLQSVETSWRRKDGRMADVSATLSPIKDSTGRVVGCSDTVRDITEQKKAADQLKRSEASLANAQRIAHIGNWDLEIATSKLWWSAEIYRIFALEPGKFGASYDAFVATVHADDRAQVVAAVQGALSGDNRYDLEHRIVRPDGTERIVHELGDVTRDAEGRPTHLSGTVQDVTERVQAAAKLRESEEAFSTAFRASPMAMVITTLEGRFVEANEAYAHLLGIPRDEIIGRTVAELGMLKPAKRTEIIGAVEQAGGSLGGIELEIRHRNGTLRTVVAGTAEITLQGGRHRLSTAIDVTEQRRAERAVRESEVRYRRLFETAKDGIVVLDAVSGTVVDMNPHLLMLIGQSLQEVLGEPIWAFPFFKEVVGDASTFAKLRDKKYLRIPHLPLQTGAGAQIEVEFISNAYEVNERKVIQCSVRDVTARRQAELALRELNLTLEKRVAERTAQLEAANRELAEHASAVSHDLRVAEASDQLKSAFLATMSHELRTPLNSIIGFTGIVLKGMAGPLNAEQTKQLGMVRGSARHLLELINDVLDLSKIEAGQLEVRAEPFDLRSSIERVIASVAPQAEKKSLTLVAALPPELGEMVSDRRRVEQILLNLVQNALKFTEHGSVTLAVDALDTPQSAVRFRIADTGIGITPGDLATLFQPFRQIDSGLARQSEGTGLGLAICRRLATLLGGEISATSEPGTGSVFTVTLPRQKTS